MKHTNGYLPKIEYHTKRISELSFSLQYGHPKYIGGLTTRIASHIKRLEYFITRHCEVSGGVVGVV
jgi:hypothetical protein